MKFLLVKCNILISSYLKNQVVFQSYLICFEQQLSSLPHNEVNHLLPQSAW